MRLSIDAKAGLERYLGAWAHMLVASNDLIDMMHEHPLLADGGPQMEFEVVFPRPGVYRVWIQLQSDNTVNTVQSRSASRQTWNPLRKASSPNPESRSPPTAECSRASSADFDRAWCRAQ